MPRRSEIAGGLAADGTAERVLAAVAVGAVALLTLAAGLRRVWSSDFGWQMATGRFVSEQGWPTVDVFSYTAAGEPWIELRWLYCWVAHRIAEIGGTGGLVVVKGIAVLAAFALIAVPTWRRETRVTTALVLLFAVLAGSQRYLVRPELVTYVLFSLFVVLLDRHRRLPLERRRRDRALLALPLLQILWVNSHPLFIYGVLLVGLLVVSEVLASLMARESTTDRRDRLQVPLVALGLTIAASLVNPYGLDGARLPLLLFSEMRGSIFRDVISELGGPFVMGLDFFAIRWYVALIVLSTLAALTNLRRLDPFWTILWASQGLLSLLSVRNLALFCLASVPFVVDNLRRSPWLERFRVTASGGVAGRGAAVGVVVVSLVIAWQLVTDRVALRQNESNQWGLGRAAHRFPDEAIDFIEQAGLDGRIFATLLESSELIRRGHPVFADPRLEVYGEPLFAEYLRAQADPETFVGVVRRYDIRSVLVDLQSSFVALLGRVGFELVYFDEVAAVFVRPGSAPGLPVIDDDRAYANAVSRLRERLPRPTPGSSRSVLSRVTLPHPYLAVADFLLMRAQPELAEPFLDDVVAVSSHVPGVARRRVRLAELRGDTAGIVRAARAALEETPDDGQLMALLGQALGRLGERDEARSWLDRSVKAAPDEPLVWLLLARHGLAHDDPQTAERGFRRALELDPDATAVRGELVRLLVSRQRVADAVRVVQDGLLRHPDDAVLLRLEEALAGER